MSAVLSGWQKAFLALAVCLYLAAGVSHFLFSGAYVQIVPPFFPAPLAVVRVSGVAELAGALGLMVPRLRIAAAWGITALLVAVFPANVYMAANNIGINGRVRYLHGHFGYGCCFSRF